jgi:hypothetical protein
METKRSCMRMKGDIILPIFHVYYVEREVGNCILTSDELLDECCKEYFSYIIALIHYKTIFEPITFFLHDLCISTVLFIAKLLDEIVYKELQELYSVIQFQDDLDVLLRQHVPMVDTIFEKFFKTNTFSMESFNYFIQIIEKEMIKIDPKLKEHFENDCVYIYELNKIRY